jgi:hypothetical protein
MSIRGRWPDEEAKAAAYAQWPQAERERFILLALIETRRAAGWIGGEIPVTLSAMCDRGWIEYVVKKDADGDSYVRLTRRGKEAARAVKEAIDKGLKPRPKEPAPLTPGEFASMLDADWQKFLSKRWESLAPDDDSD